MGARYIIELECPRCAFHDDDVPYAPSSGFTEWICPQCGELVDLGVFLGIEYSEAELEQGGA